MDKIGMLKNLMFAKNMEYKIKKAEKEIEKESEKEKKEEKPKEMFCFICKKPILKGQSYKILPKDEKHPERRFYHSATCGVGSKAWAKMSGSPIAVALAETKEKKQEEEKKKKEQKPKPKTEEKEQKPKQKPEQKPEQKPKQKPEQKPKSEKAPKEKKEANVPEPTGKKFNINPSFPVKTYDRYPFKDMEVGDYVIEPDTSIDGEKSIRNWSNRFAFKRGWKFSVRRIDSGFRCVRIQ